MSEIMRELAVQISVNGASAGQKDIKGLQNTVVQADATFKSAGAGIKGYEKTIAGMQSRVDMLKQKMFAQSAIVEKSNSAYEKARARVQAAATEQAKYATKVDTARAKLAAEVAATGKNSEASKALAADLEKLEGQYAAQVKSVASAERALNKNQTSLLQAQAALKITESELKTANGTLQKHTTFWGKASLAVEGFAKSGKKITSFGKSMTTVVTAPIVAGYAAAYKAWEMVDDGMDTVIRKTGATGDALKPLEKAYNNVFLGVKTSAADAGIAIGEVNTRFKATGKQLEETSKVFIQFADVNETDLNESIGKVQKNLSQWGLGISDVRGYLGLLTSESQRTGLSVDSLMDSVQANGATLKAMGFNLSQSVQLLANFESAGINADVALAALKKSAGNYAKDGQSLEKGLTSTVTAIQKAKTETEALAIAQKIFGAKGALEMVTAIREGRFSINGLSADMSKMGDVVTKTFNEIYGDTPILDKVKNKLIAAGAQFEKSALPWIEKAADKFGQLVDGFAALSPASQSTILTLSAVGAAAGPVIATIGKLATGIGALSKLFVGPAGWVALAVAGFSTVNYALNQLTENMKNGARVKIDVEGAETITENIENGKAAAQATADIIAGVASDAEALKSTVDAALANRDISGKEFNAISLFVTSKVNPDIEAGKKALDEKVAAYKLSLDSAVDANGNKYTDEDKDVMIADFQAKNSKLIVDIQVAKENYTTLLQSLQKQTSPITDAQITQLNEQASKLFALTEQLRIASDTVAAAGQANYALVTSGNGNKDAIGSSIGFVQQNKAIAEAEALQKRQAALAAAGENTDLSAQAWTNYYADMKTAAQDAQLSYQAIADGVAKMAGVSTTLETINQDTDAFRQTMELLSGLKLDGTNTWMDQFKTLFGAGGDLEKYLSDADKKDISELLIPANYNDDLAFQTMTGIAERLRNQLAEALGNNALNNEQLSPVMSMLQSMLDAGVINDLDVTQLQGALEGALKAVDLDARGADVGKPLVTGINAGIGWGVTNVGFDSQMEDLSNAVVSSAKSALKINSPAKVMEPVGAGIVEGVAYYISSNQGTAVNAVTTMFQAAIAEANRMTPKLRAALSYFQSASSNGPGYTYGGYNNAERSMGNNYSSTANQYIENYTVNTGADAQAILAEQAELAKRARRGYGSRG